MPRAAGGILLGAGLAVGARFTSRLHAASFSRRRGVRRLPLERASHLAERARPALHVVLPGQGMRDPRPCSAFSMSARVRFI